MMSSPAVSESLLSDTSSSTESGKQGSTARDTNPSSARVSEARSAAPNPMPFNRTFSTVTQWPYCTTKYRSHQLGQPKAPTQDDELDATPASCCGAVALGGPFAFSSPPALLGPAPSEAWAASADATPSSSQGHASCELVSLISSPTSTFVSWTTSRLAFPSATSTASFEGVATSEGTKIGRERRTSSSSPSSADCDPMPNCSAA
mmetsp:Transcript_17369/g.47332  ORF Transcript_17369/g.47332 Transcript_17369/m.47332 type:complete len:205 (+) Transcript_17369:2862-3476(+)